LPPKSAKSCAIPTKIELVRVQGHPMCRQTTWHIRNLLLVIINGNLGHILYRVRDIGA